MGKFHKTLIDFKNNNVPDLVVLNLIGTATGKRTYDDVHDAFVVGRLTTWADAIVNNPWATRYQWAGNRQTLFFDIKSSFTATKDAKIGFEICPYTNSLPLIKAVEKTLVPVAKEVFGFKAEKHESKKTNRTYFHWDFPGGVVPIEKIKLAIQEMVKKIDEQNKE